jgi:hypothetical protein
VRTVRTLEKKLPTLSEALDDAACDRLYVLAIETLKNAAFVRIGGQTDFVWNCYHLISSVWKKVCGNAATQVPDWGGPDEPALDLDDFLGGWKRDLCRVRPESLSSYVGILSWEGLAGCPTFAEALEELEQRLLKRVGRSELPIMDRCGMALIRDVLDSITDTARGRVISSLVPATRIACHYGLRGFLDSMESLDTVLRHLGQPRKTDGDGVCEEDAPLAHAHCDLLDILSDTYQEARQKKLTDLCLRLASLIPSVGGWGRDRRRKAPGDFKIRVKFVLGKNRAERNFNGIVKDLVRNFGEDRPYYHVCLEGLIDCVPVATSEEPLPGEEEHNSVMLCVTDKRGKKYRFREALAELKIPADCPGKTVSKVESRVRPIRGWRYQYANKGKIGIVFWLENPPTLDAGQLQIVRSEDGEAERSAIPEEVHPVEPKGALRKGGHQLLQDISQWLEEFAASMERNRRYRGLWTGSGKRGLRPVDELAIDAQIREQLKEFVESHDGSLSCQEDTGWGPCDYIVRHRKDKVVIELKPSYGEWKKGISNQLPDYMEQAKTKHGLFLVFAFAASFQKDSKELEELCALSERVSKSRGMCIDIVVINCDRPKSATQGPRLKDRFQYYKGPSLGPEGDE